MPRVGFEPTISAGERPKTYALDRPATGTGIYIYIYIYIYVCVCVCMYVCARVYTSMSLICDKSSPFMFGNSTNWNITNRSVWIDILRAQVSARSVLWQFRVLTDTLYQIIVCLRLHSSVWCQHRCGVACRYRFQGTPALSRKGGTGFCWESKPYRKACYFLVPSVVSIASF